MARNAFGDEIVESRTGPAVNAFGDPVEGTTPASGRRAQDIGDAIIAGLQSSATGLAIRGKLPSQQLDEESPWYQRLAAGGAGVVADLPLSIAGAVAAAPAGPIASLAGAFAAPMALRDALMEAYGNDHALSWAGAWEIGKAALKGGTKGAVIGAATGGAGRLAAPLLAPVGKVGAAVGTAGAEIGTLTTTAAAIDGHMPTWQDFMDNAILLGGMKAAVSVAGGLRNVYAETGRTPERVLTDAAKDPTIAADLAEKVFPKAYAPVALDQRIQSAIDADPRPEMIRSNIAAKEPAKFGENLAQDPVKYEYITDSDTAKGVLRAVTGMYQAEILAQTRGVVPNKETAAAGLRMATDGVLDPHLAGQAGTAAEIWARVHVLKGATNHAVNELAKIANVAEADLTPAMKLQALAALERVAMLKAEVEGVGAEAGRALQIFRAVKRDPAMVGEANMLLAAAERKGGLQDIAALALQMKDPAQLARFAQEYTKATTTEKVLEAWKAGILSGPQTHLANILGNTGKWMTELPENVVSATFTAADRAVRGDPLTMEQFKARAFAPIYGLQMGAKDALHVAAEVWRGSGENLEKGDVYRTAIEGRKGEIIRTPFKALQVEDALFRTVAERAEAHIMAVDRATKLGLDPRSAEFREQVVQWTARPELGLSDAAGVKAIERVQQAGAEAVFAQRLGPRLEQVQRAMAGHWTQFIVPFFRTPANLVSWAVQHTPGLNFMSGRWREDFAAGGERQARAVARITVGTGLAVTAYTLAQDGFLTGGGMFDKEQRGTKAAAGWQPYSVKIGDNYYSYQRIEPVAKVLGIAADLVELQAATKDPEDKAKIASMLVLMFGNATVSTTYLSGLSNAIQAVTDPDRRGENFLEQYANSTVPKIIGQSVTAADPYKREVDGVLDAIQSQLPFLREKLLPKRDVWGEPVANDRWFAVMPVAKTQVSDDKVRTEAARLQLAIADAPKGLVEKGPFKPGDKRVELTIEQRDIFRAVSGKAAMEILRPMVNAADWTGIPDFAKAEIFKEVIKGSREQGMYAAMPPDEASRVKLRQGIIDKIIKQTQEAEGR